MERKGAMRGIKLEGYGTFTFAPEIMNYCRKNGYDPYVDPERRIHPGTECNAKIYSLMKDPAAKRRFCLGPHDVIDISFGHRENEVFIDTLIEECFISAAYRSRPGVTLYSPKATSYLCAVMLDDPDLIADSEHPVNIQCALVYDGRVRAVSHKFEKKKYRRPAKLFEGGPATTKGITGEGEEER